MSLPRLEARITKLVQSTMSDSSSIRNESISSSTRTWKSGRFTYRSTKQLFTLRNTSDSSIHSSSEVTEAGLGNECNFIDELGLDRVSHIEEALDFASISEGYTETETSDGDMLWRQAPFVCVSSLSCPFSVC